MLLRLKSKLVVVALLVVVAVGGYLWRNSVRNQIAQSAAAVVPDLAGRDSELVERVQMARKQIQLGQKPVEALATLTRLYYANGWFVPASRTCAGLIELEPRNPRWTYLLALLRANAGQLHEALPLLLRTIELAPDYAPARLKAASVMTKLNQADAAIAVEKVVLEKDPANIYAWVGLGNIYVAQKKWDLAKTSFQKAISFSDQFRPAWLGMVAVYEAEGNSLAATDAQSRVDAVSRSPDSPDPWIDPMIEECYDVYYLRVAAYSSTDKDFSQRLLERAVRLQPKDADVRRDLGMFLFRINSFGDARRHLMEATALAPDNSENWLSLITFLNALRDAGAVDQAIRNGLAHCPTSAGLWLERGRFSARARALDDAFAAFKRSAEFGPKDAAPHVEAAVAYFQLDQAEKALSELKTALSLQPNHPFAQVVMARYAIVVRDKATALIFFEKARRNPGVLAEDKQQLTAAFEAAFGPHPR